MGNSSLQTLYQNIGGEEGLRKIVLDFYQRMARDVMIGFFFAGRNVEAIALKQVHFLQHAMGVLPFYEGLSPASAHHSLPPIRRGMFDRRIQLLQDTLRDHGVSSEDMRSWIDFEQSFRDSVEHG